MIYLSVDKNSIKLLSLSKSILNQFSVSYFKKNHETDLLESGLAKNTDLLASSIKEGLTMAYPKEIKDRDVTLILPQEAFVYSNYSIPTDISESAIMPFVKDKTRAEFPFDVEETHHDFYVFKQNNESQVAFYALKKEDFAKFNEAFKLLGLNIVSVIPDTLCFFKLFEKTLKADKKENILYTFYDKDISFAYLFNSFGLLKREKITFEKDKEMEESLKIKVNEFSDQNIKINRIILSGNESEKIRQDLFTKNVGAWTNPFKKIAATFYNDYLKMLLFEKENHFSFLDFDVCLGAFIFSQENKEFSIIKTKSFWKNKNTINVTSENNNKAPLFKVTSRDVVIFILSVTLSAGAIIGFSKIKIPDMSLLSFGTKEVKITPTQIPLPSPTPTPILNKEELRVKVLNGGGTPGKATEVTSIFKKLGYTETLNGRNADNFDYEVSEVQIKDDKKFAFETLKTDLKEYVTLQKITSLEATSTADLIFIIGKDFK